MSKVILKDVRASYVFVTSPRQETNKDDQGNEVVSERYSMQILIRKDDTEQVNAIKAAIKAAAVARFGASVKMGMLKLPLRDGDEEREEEEYQGHYFINANTYRRPGIVNRQNKAPNDSELEELCYSGAFFHVSVTFKAFDFEGKKKGIRVELGNVMLLRQGDRLDGSVSAEKEFEEFAEPESAPPADEDFDF